MLEDEGEMLRRMVKKDCRAWEMRERGIGIRIARAAARV